MRERLGASFDLSLRVISQRGHDERVDIFTRISLCVGYRHVDTFALSGSLQCNTIACLQSHFPDIVACSGVLKSVCVWFAAFRAECNEANSLSCFGSTCVFWGEIELCVCFSVSKVNYGGEALRDEINEKSVTLFSVRGCSRFFASPVLGKFCDWGQQVLLMLIVVFLSLITDELLFCMLFFFLSCTGEIYRWCSNFELRQTPALRTDRNVKVLFESCDQCCARVTWKQRDKRTTLASSQMPKFVYC